MHYTLGELAPGLLMTTAQPPTAEQQKISSQYNVPATAWIRPSTEAGYVQARNDDLDDTMNVVKYLEQSVDNVIRAGQSAFSISVLDKLIKGLNNSQRQIAIIYGRWYMDPDFLKDSRWLSINNSIGSIQTKLATINSWAPVQVATAPEAYIPSAPKEFQITAARAPNGTIAPTPTPNGAGAAPVVTTQPTATKPATGLLVAAALVAGYFIFAR